MSNEINIEVVKSGYVVYVRPSHSRGERSDMFVFNSHDDLGEFVSEWAKTTPPTEG